MYVESGKAQDFWTKMKDKVRENVSKSDSEEKGKQNNSNPGGFYSPGKHRGEERAHMFSAPKGKHTQDKKPNLFSKDKGRHVDKRQTPFSKDKGKHVDKGDKSTPRGKHEKPSGAKPTSLKNIHKVDFVNSDTGQRHTLHVHTNDDGSVSHVREHVPGRHRSKDEYEAHPNAPENTHPEAGGKGKGSDIPKDKVKNKPARPKMDLTPGAPAGGVSAVDPLTDPNHQVDKSLKTPIHEQLHKDTQNPLTSPGRHSNPDDPTPVADDADVANQMNQRLKGKPNSVQEIKNPGDAKNMSKDELKARRPKKSMFVPKEAASSLDQIQQTFNVHDEYDPKSMPSDVAFPIRDDWNEETTEDGDYSADRNGEYRSREAAAIKNYALELQRQAAILYKMADQFGASDSPHAVPGGSVANTPATTPPTPAGKSYESGVEDGQRDKANGDRPSFSDASSTAPDYVRGYSEGYSTAEHAPTAQDVPRSLGGDSGQSYNADRVQQRQEPLSVGASITVAASFTEPEAAGSSDFRKGYNYGWSWTPNKKLVRMGSSEFEAGLYAGITDNPENQRAFVEANKAHSVLEPRLATHRQFTQYLLENDNEYYGRGLYIQGSTSTDLNIMGPGVAPDPMGQTPQMGQGTPPPNEGGTDPARPGGPAPYNGAPPYSGGPVVEDPVMGPSQEEKPEANPSEHDTDNDGNRAPNGNVSGEGPMHTSSLNPRLAAFRERVQSTIRERRGQ